jgi:hypothetical protein
LCSVSMLLRVASVLSIAICTKNTKLYVYEVQSYQVASEMQRPKWLHKNVPSIWILNLNFEEKPGKKSMEEITLMTFSHLPSWMHLSGLNHVWLLLELNQAAN